MKESNAGKQCIMVQFPRQCTPDICSLLFCEHVEDEPEELCPYTGHECFEDCIACPVIAEDWERHTKTIDEEKKDA